MLFDRKTSPKDQVPAPELDAQAHGHRMAGLWAAELLGLIGHAAHDYAREVAHGHEGAPDDERVIGRLARDLHGKVTAHEIREKLTHLMHEARKQLLNDRQPR